MVVCRFFMVSVLVCVMIMKELLLWVLMVVLMWLIIFCCEMIFLFGLWL